ncbi:MAG: EAL domain-containing protein [Proteobacteria bacterium]|nr:EAL domain-containing protein [Pseudomonadota bacterium]
MADDRNATEMRWLALRGILIRNRGAALALVAILLAALAALFVAYEVDIFRAEGLAEQTETIEIDEILLISAVVTFSLLVFGAIQYRAQKREVMRRIEAERRARELAYQDGLTGLPNRRQFDEALATLIASPPRTGASHAVLLLDLNGFKQINDVFGHAVGDHVLIVVAQRLRAAIRDSDMVARFGGDEFAILAPHLADPEAATNVALRIIEALRSPVSSGKAAHSVGLGIGIALIPQDASSADDALRKADVALYRAKAERRSALRFFEPEMDQRVKERADLELALRAALQNKQIHTAFQPAVNVRTGRIIGFEISPLWTDPVRGTIDMQRFVAIAEEVGLIHDLAEAILRQGCEAAVGWPDYTRLSVDLFPSQLVDHQLPERVLRILAEYGLAPQRLEMEITESALVADMGNSKKIVDALRAAGVRVALKNFGTGYSSLFHLRNLQLDKLKIDRSFISDMRSSKASAAIVDALVGLGHGLGLTIAAEGIEGLEQEATALRAGCDEADVSHFGRMLSPEQTQALFVNEKARIA